MNEYQNPEKVAETGKDQLRTVAENFKEAASAKAEDIRQAAGQRADELRSAMQGRAQELKESAQTTLSDIRFQAKRWQAEGEAYVRDNPVKAVSMGLGLGFLTGLLLRK
jgi:ElaB/YqjD/DUF883 family membrane-anchored ribosome-binding protein